MHTRHFIQVLLPLRLEWVPCYGCASQVSRGDRVLVDFARREYVGVVLDADAVPEVEESRIADVKSLDTGLPPVSEQELQFWEFLSSYYLCSPGEVYKAAYPAVKVRSEQNAAAVAKRADERRIASREKMLAVMKSRLDRLHERMERIGEDIARRQNSTRSSAAVTARLNDTLMQLKEQEASLLAAMAALDRQEPIPASVSTRAADHEDGHFSTAFIGDPSDAVIIDHTREALERGCDALVLVPEISLGTSLAESFEKALPGHVLTMTSQNTPVQRRRVADAVRSSESPVVVVGTRVTLFLPFRNLGLVIVTGEQDESYKQTEPAPRYNTRDAAVMLGRIHGARVLLCSPSPSLETVWNVLNHKYASSADIGTHTTLDAESVEVVDISAERRKNGMLGIFSRKLLAAAGETPGRIALIRGWEKPDELNADIERLLHGRDVDVMTFPESRRARLSEYSFVAVLQFDVLLSGEGFRTDERAAQRLAMLCKQCVGTRLLIQTSRSGHPVFTGMDLNAMLQERRDFSLPPFMRLVDVVFDDANEARKQLMMSRIELRDVEQYGDRLRKKIPADRNLQENKRILKEKVLAFEKEYRYQGHIFLDVDPL